MWKACSRCGRIHKENAKCSESAFCSGGNERTLRNKYAWHKKSLSVREAAGWLCEVCKAEGRYTYDNLEVHHITKVRDDESKLLDDANLICLCPMHHKKADAGEIEPETLRKLARERDG